MVDQALTIRIEAQDEFSPVFTGFANALATVKAATEQAAAGFSNLGEASADAQAKLDGAQSAWRGNSRSADDSGFRSYGGSDGSGRSSQAGERFLENHILPPAARAGFAGYRQGGNIEALGAQYGVDFQGVADNLSGMTNGLTSGLSGGMLAGGVGAGLSLLMQNPVMQADMKRLNDLLQELITPIAESIGLSLDAIAPLMMDLRPVFVLIGESLKLYLSPLVQELRGVFQADWEAVGVLKA